MDSYRQRQISQSDGEISDGVMSDAMFDHSTLLKICWCIVGTFMEVFGIFAYLWKSLLIFGKFRTMFRNVRVTFGQLLKNLWISPESGQKSSENIDRVK